MITGSVIFYLHTDNQIRVLYIIGLQIDLRQPLLTQISLDSRDSRQNCAENLLRFAMYNVQCTISY